jgi:hypothetical protein
VEVNRVESGRISASGPSRMSSVSRANSG